MMKNNQLKLVITGDGSWTLHSDQYDETFHSISGAVDEAFCKHVRPCGLETLAESGRKLRILDVCFGLGYNVLAAWHTVKQANQNADLEIISLEKDIALLESLINQTLPSPFEDYQTLLKELLNTGCYEEGNRKIQLVLGDATLTIDKLEGKFDAVFWDPFSPPKNPEMWTLNIFKKVFRMMNDRSILTTYSANQRVRKGLLEAGFKIGQGPAVGRKRGGTLASIKAPLPPLPEKDLTKIKTKEAF